MLVIIPEWPPSPIGSLIIGLLAGMVVVFSVLFIDNILKIDDPVGAVSVHGVCGALGTILLGFFDVGNGLFYGGDISFLGVQALGILAGFVWAFGLGWILFSVIKRTVGLRVSEEEELQGLDIGEHGMEGYYGFQIFMTQ